MFGNGNRIYRRIQIVPTPLAFFPKTRTVALGVTPWRSAFGIEVPFVVRHADLSDLAFGKTKCLGVLVSQ
jgi:hypothetical protein